MSSGKDFEKDFSNSFKGKERARILRLYDTTNGFHGIANPCDFIYYNYPYLAYLELKSVKDNRLPFSNITDRQWEELSFRNKQPGCIGAIVIQFREAKEGYLVAMDCLEELLKQGYKSITLDQAVAYGMNLKLHYKRTRCYLDPLEFQKDLFLYTEGRKNE